MGMSMVVTVTRIRVTLLILRVKETLKDLTYGADAVNRNGVAEPGLNRRVTVMISMVAVTSNLSVARPVRLGPLPGSRVIVSDLTVGISRRTTS